jgi:CubicO group peptidase (beta-lactamase class C family)
MERAERIAAAAQRHTDSKKFAGIEWLVEHHGKTIASGRSGYADVQTRTPIPDGALYRIYSMTKPVVSVMALILIEQGRLHLYDMLAAFNPAFANMRVLLPNGAFGPATRPILVEDLITHRAGFTYEFITGCHIAPLYMDAKVSSDGLCSLEEMMARIAAIPLAFQPGSAFRYSVATDVLAHVIERATGRGIDELLEEFILAPLGMTDTAYHVPPAKRERLMSMYGVADVSEFAPLTPRPNELTPADVEQMYPWNRPGQFRRGGHGLFSTIADYAKFARMLLNGKAPDGRVIVSRKMLEMMRSNRIPPEQLPLRIGMNALPGYGWGLGVRVMMDPGRALGLCSIGEFGWSGAASTYFWVDPLESMIGVVMTQYLGSMLPLSDHMRTAAYQMID